MSLFLFLTVVQALVAAALVGVILMQRSEGGGLGVGGSPSGLMSARGAANLLTRATAFLAIGFVGLSIALAFLTGNILAMLVFVVLPSTIAAGGRPSAGAFRIARMLGQHVGEEGLRRRARRIQDLMQTVGPLAGELRAQVAAKLDRRTR